MRYNPLLECKDYNYVITSGWWCGKALNEKRVRHGSESIREMSFFRKWKTSILENTNPMKIMVLDSASDITPSSEDKEGIEFFSLNRNAGHSTSHSGKYSGYMRSIIMGITYAKLCDADYWIYVEQDALLKGKGIIEHCISKMTKPYMFGSGEGTPQILQQSLIIIRKDGYDNFLHQLDRIKLPDSLISPETKFLIASSRFYQFIPEKLYLLLTKKTKNAIRFKDFIYRTLPKYRNYDHLPIGYGRTRPIDFTKPFYYFQHGSEEELHKHFTLISEHHD